MKQWGRAAQPKLRSLDLDSGSLTPGFTLFSHIVFKWDGSHWMILSNDMVRGQRTPPPPGCCVAETAEGPRRGEGDHLGLRPWWSEKVMGKWRGVVMFWAAVCIHSLIHPFIHSFIHFFSGCSYAPFIVPSSPVRSPMWDVKDCGGEGRYNSHPHKVQNLTRKGDRKHDCIRHSRRSGLLGHVGLISEEQILWVQAKLSSYEAAGTQWES